MESTVSINNLTHFYGYKKALDNITMTISQGEIYALLGPNGAGKTTCLRIVAGLHSASRGGVTTLGLDPVKQNLLLKEKVGYLSETEGLLEWMSIEKHFNFHRAFYSNWDSKMAYNLTDELKLDRKEEIKNLSKGQKRQVALIMVSAQHPEFLILDEPAGGLDPAIRRSFLSVIIRLIHEEGRTVFFSSHITSDVERVATKVGFLKEGRIILEEALDKLKETVKKVVLRGEAKIISSKLSWLGKKEENEVIEGVVHQENASIFDEILKQGPEVQVFDLSLEDIYLSVVEKGNGVIQ